MDIQQVGAVSKTDVVVCYMADKVDPAFLDKVKKKIQSITIPSLTMGQESLAECLVKRQWFNPFPKMRYTERPDCAAASLLEGRILLLVDNSSAAMILPTSIFDFIQDTNDYYFPPLVGSYLRLVRALVFIATLFLTPVWYLLVRNPEVLPEWLRFIQIQEPNTVPLFLQLMTVELIIDGIKLASLNTPNVLNNAFGVVGALILGEFAVSAGLFVPEVLLYMAFVAIANFTQPSFELGYAFKLFRMLFLVFIALADWWGFGAGVLLMILCMVTTPTVCNSGYLYPLIPFNWKAIRRLLFRRALSSDNS
jgi:spore germination protein AF